MSQKEYIFGLHAVGEALKAKKNLSKVFVQSNISNPKLKELLYLLKKNKVPYSMVPVQKLNKLTHHNHQGILAQLDIITYGNLEQILENMNDEGLFVLLDGITDTRNLGAIIRSAAAARATAVIIPTTGSAQITGETIKTSSGGVFKVPICRVNHLKDALYLLQSYEVQCVVADEKIENHIFSINLKKSTAIVMGAEDKGVSSGVRSLCDAQAKLPMLGTMDSYNVSVAAGMFLYEAMRQRLQG